MSSSICTFSAGTEIRPQLINPPRPVGIVAHAQVVAHQFLIVEFQFVSQKAVDPVHREMLAPVVAPLRLVIALHREDQLPSRSARAGSPRRCALRCTPPPASTSGSPTRAIAPGSESAAASARRAAGSDRSRRSPCPGSPPPGPCRGGNPSRRPALSAGHRRSISRSPICPRRDTVQGLWHSVPRGREPTSRHAVPGQLLLQFDAETVGQKVHRSGAQRQPRLRRRRAASGRIPPACGRRRSPAHSRRWDRRLSTAWPSGCNSIRSPSRFAAHR